MTSTNGKPIMTYNSNQIERIISVALLIKHEMILVNMERVLNYYIIFLFTNKSKKIDDHNIP